MKDKGSFSTLVCVKISKGHGVVTQKLGAEYIEVKFEDGVSFQEGDVVEKHAH